MASPSKRRVDDICRNINVVLRKYCPGVPAISSLSELNARTLLRLFDATCGPFLQERPLLPDVDRDPVGLLQVLIDVVACDFLNVDLAPRITGQKLATHDEEAVSSFISILDKLSTCLEDERKQRASDDGRLDEAAPSRTKLTPPLRRLGKRSVLYSPRTAFRRSSTRSTAIRQSVKEAVRRMRPTILEPELQSSILRDSRPSNMNNSIYRLQLRQIALNNRASDMKIAEAVGSTRFDIIERTKEAGRRRRELIELKQARALLDNAKAAARHRAIADSRRQDAVNRYLAAQRLRLEATKMIATDKVRDAWAQSANAAKSEFASRLKSETQVKSITVLQRIAALENRQKIRERIIRDQYDLQ